MAQANKLANKQTNSSPLGATLAGGKWVENEEDNGEQDEKQEQDVPNRDAKEQGRSADRTHLRVVR